MSYGVYLCLGLIGGYFCYYDIRERRLPNEAQWLLAGLWGYCVYTSQIGMSYWELWFWRDVRAFDIFGVYRLSGDTRFYDGFGRYKIVLSLCDVYRLAIYTLFCVFVCIVCAYGIDIS